MTPLSAAAIAIAGLACLPAAAAAADPAANRHLRAPAAGQVAAADAEALYRELAPAMAAAYALSGDAAATGYRFWTRHNGAPYLSATHGDRYVNNYANGLAADYARVATGGGALPTGAVVAKDSFTITPGGESFPAALFLMEKLAPGTSPDTGDWRYAMILPDGTFFGDSRGPDAAQMDYCHDCHRARQDTDFLFFLPDTARAGQPQDR